MILQQQFLGTRRPDMEDSYHFEQADNRVTYAGTLDTACRCQEIASYRSREDTQVSSVRPILRVRFYPTDKP
jgi:hypothetical protein